MTTTATATATHEDMTAVIHAAMLLGGHAMSENVAAYSHENGNAKALRAWCVKCNAQATFEHGRVTFHAAMVNCLFPYGMFTRAFGSGE